MLLDEEKFDNGSPKNFLWSHAILCYVTIVPLKVKLTFPRIPFPSTFSNLSLLNPIQDKEKNTREWKK